MARIIKLFKNNKGNTYRKISFTNKASVVFEGISQENYDKAVELGAEVISYDGCDVTDIPLTIEQYQDIFKLEQAKLISQYDWVHIREKRRDQLNIDKKSRYTQYCQYQEDVSNMDDLTINPTFDVTNPIWPNKPE